MIIEIASDLHFEMMTKTQVRGVIDNFNGKADVLVLAGDIFSGKMTTSFISECLKSFSDKYAKVLYVMGNHDHYLTYLHKDLKFLDNQDYYRALCDKAGVHMLTTDTPLIWNGQRFLGDTMWFSEWKGSQHYKFQMNDFNLIQDLEPHVYEHNQRFKEMLTNNLNEHDVVVTHHMPSMKCVHPAYKGSHLNRFFVSEMDDLIKERQPELWLFGHSHESTGMMMGRTRLLSNPKGYPHERKHGFAFEYGVTCEV